MKLQDWKETQLWARHLAQATGIEAEACRQACLAVLDRAQQVMQQGSTAPLDFTLHDAQHGFRVAERMVELLSDEVMDRLSHYEHAILLLSAYLHDIGMTPVQSELVAHRELLLTGSSTLESKSEAIFRSWLAQQHPEPKIPLGQGSLSSETLCRCDLLLAHYARSRHNDWSEQWIRATVIKNSIAGMYAGWVDDVVRVCLSHHWGDERLIQDEFDPRPVSSKSVVHLRFLACVLRLADILENDPERTPEIVYTHRGISAGSQIFWWKDHSLVTQIHREAGAPRRIVLSASPPSAIVHKAVLETVEAIEQEVRLCNRVRNRKPFDRDASGRALAHAWDINPEVQVDIREGNYKYIDSTFRAETSRVLDLVAGLSVYDSPLSAVRELVQNAFDAVKVQVAHELLLQNSDSPVEESVRLARRHRVTLDTEVDEESRLWLICRDDGVGMSARTIEREFLVCGRPTSPRRASLRSECERMGVRSLHTTGRFGLGVLSYFMLGDRVVARTTPSVESGQSGVGECWRFSTEGVGSFGELTPLERCAVGTEIRIRVRSDIVGESVSAWRARVCEYLTQVVTTAPCVLDLSRLGGVAHSGSLACTESVRQKLGHAREQRHLRGLFVSTDESPYLPNVVDLVPQEEPDSARVDLCLSKLKLKVVEGNLEGDLGTYRIVVPYFEYERGTSLVYFEFLDENESQSRLNLIGGNAGWNPRGSGRVSWYGIALSGVSSSGVEDLLAGRAPSASDQGHESLGAFVEIDFTTDTAGVLKMSREGMEFSAQAIEACRCVGRLLGNVRSQILENGDNRLLALNLGGRRVHPSVENVELWWFDEESKCIRPHIWNGEWDEADNSPEEVAVCRAPSIAEALIGSAGTAGLRVSKSFVPHRLSIAKGAEGGFRVRPQWLRAAVSVLPRGSTGASMVFSDDWRDVVAVETQQRVFWNQSTSLGDPGLVLAEGAFTFSLASVEKLASTEEPDATTARCFFRFLLPSIFGSFGGRALLWLGLWQKRPVEMLRLWHAAFGGEERTLMFVGYDSFSDRLRVVKFGESLLSQLAEDSLERFVALGESPAVVRVPGVLAPSRFHFHS